MNRVFNLDLFKSNNSPVILIFGVFDGMHIGHQKLIEKAVEIKKEQGGKLLFVLFPVI